MTSINTRQTGKPALFVFLMGAVLFNLSSLPGTSSQVTFQSTELMSVLLECDIEGQIEVNGVAECGDLRSNNIRGRITVERVERQAPAEGQTATAQNAAPLYKVTSEVEGRICAPGVEDCPLSSVSRTTSNFGSLNDIAANLFRDQAKAAAESKRDEEDRLARVEACEEDEEGNEITKLKKQLECRMEKMSSLNDEEAEEYYDEYLKDDLQSLLQSNSPNDRALAMKLLSDLGKDLRLSCPTRPGLQNDGNPFLNQANLNPLMSSATSRRSQREESRSYVKESVCDLWAFGTYNHNVEYLKLAAASASEQNRPALQNALNSLKSGWGVYFQQRGLQIQSDPMAMFGRGDSLMSGLNYNNDALTKGLEAITAQHQDILGATLIQPQAPTGALAGGRTARGGLPNQTGVAPGTAVTQPWPAAPGGSAPAVAQPSPSMVPMNNSQPFRIPQFGEPVGTPPAN